MVQVNKFTIAEDWTPKKLDVVIDAPNELDLTPYRGRGLQPGEVELPEEEESPSEEGTPPVPPACSFVHVADCKQELQAMFTVCVSSCN